MLETGTEGEGNSDCASSQKDNPTNLTQKDHGEGRSIKAGTEIKKEFKGGVILLTDRCLIDILCINDVAAWEGRNLINN